MIQKQELRLHLLSTMPEELILHTGLLPFVAADGRVVAGYQLLNSERKALADATVIDGEVTKTFASESLSPAQIESFLGESLSRFKFRVRETIEEI